MLHGFRLKIRALSGIMDKYSTLLILLAFLEKTRMYSLIADSVTTIRV